MGRSFGSAPFCRSSLRASPTDPLHDIFVRPKSVRVTVTLSARIPYRAEKEVLSTNAEAMKRDAAVRAAERIEDGMTVGLGTGSTVRYLIDHLAAVRAEGRLRRIVAVPTSSTTEKQALRLGIPLCTLMDHRVIDLTIDGADEVDPQLRLIKGLGGALLREKVVASVSRAFVVIVDESKLVDRLGSRCPLPVEVDPFAAPVLAERLRAYGSEPALRLEASGSPFVSDGGHYILDCAFPGGIEDPETLEWSLRGHPGVLETGLFLGMTTSVVVAGLDGVREIDGSAGQASGRRSIDGGRIRS